MRAKGFPRGFRLSVKHRGPEVSEKMAPAQRMAIAECHVLELVKGFSEKRLEVF
jgi:hypothetical protein